MRNNYTHKELENELIERIAQAETTLSLLLPEKERLHEELIKLGKTVVEARKDTEQTQEKLKELERKFRWFITSVGAFLASAISAVASYLLK